MSTAEAGQSQDRIAVDTEEASGLADAAPLGQVFEHGDGGLFREMAAVPRRALAFGEAGAALLAAELSLRLVLAEPAADRKVVGVAVSVERAVGSLAAEEGEILHGVG